MSDSPLLIPEQKVDLVLDMGSPALVLGGTVAAAPQPLPSPLDHTVNVMVPDPMLPLELPGIRKVIQGERGPPGTRGARGEIGNKGNTGFSAYEDWLRRGNAGSFEDFLGAIGGGLNLEDFRNSLVDAVKDRIDPTLNAQLQQLVSMQMYLDAQILNTRQEILDSANSLANQITQEQLARADAILAERMRLDANIQSEAFARQDADESVTNELKAWTTGYEGFSSVYSWNFSVDAAGWENAHGQPLTVFNSPSTNDHGWGYTPLPDSTPMLKSPASLDLDNVTCTHVRVRVRKMGSPVWQGVLTSETGAVIATIPEPEWSDQGEATLTFLVPGWSGATGIRLLIQQDAAEAGHHFMYRYVAIGNTMPAASTALVTKEVSLISNAVESVATDQTLLAAQFRGDYEGSDINGVTEGLLFQERQARADQDSAITQDVTTLRSRLDTGDIATAISSLNTNVSNLDGAIQAEAGRIDGVSASVGDVQSQVTQQSQALAATDGRVRAMHTVALNVNGHISGTVSENNGTTSSFSVLADVFRVFSSALQGFEIQNGYQRNYSAGAQLVMGHNFGVNNDLVLWYGPNIGAAACTKGNATIWFDKSGNAYFGGTLSAGILKNGATTTSTQTIGLELTVGPFSTNGKQRSVLFSFSRIDAWYYSGYGNQGFNPGAGNNQTTVVVYRKLSGGAETIWRTFTINGSQEILNEFDGPDSVTNYWGYSETFTENTPSNQTVTYRAVITGHSEKTFSHSSGSGPTSRNLTQAITILSTEST